MQIVVAGVHVLSSNLKVNIFEPKVPEALAAPAQAAMKKVVTAASGAAR
jgi:hypothetical protein